MTEFNYQDLLNLGFERIDLDCSVFRKQYGYGCFLLEYRTRTKGIYFKWEPENRQVQLLKGKQKTGDIYSRMMLDLDMEKLKALIGFFDSCTNVTNDQSETENNYFNLV